MKLIYCKECRDVVALRAQPRTCECGKSGGTYKDDGLHAAIWGSAVPLGFANTLFRNALLNRPQKAPGRVFEAFVIERECPTVEMVDPPNNVSPKEC